MLNGHVKQGPKNASGILKLISYHLKKIMDNVPSKKDRKKSCFLPEIFPTYTPLVLNITMI